MNKAELIEEVSGETGLTKKVSREAVDAIVSAISDSLVGEERVTLALVGVTIAYVIVTGSYNWTASAGERNNENLLVIRDPPLASRYKQEFDPLWSKHYLGEERPEAPIQ